MDVTSCWLLIILKSFPTLQELHIVRQETHVCRNNITQTKSDIWMLLSSESWEASVCSCLPSSFFISLRCPFILSFPSSLPLFLSLPRCRLNLSIYSVREQSWVVGQYVEREEGLLLLRGASQLRMISCLEKDMKKRSWIMPFFFFPAKLTLKKKCISLILK